MNTNFLGRLTFTAVVAACLAGVSLRAAAAFPEKPVKIIHAYPGAPVDAAVRFVADKLTVMWKQPVLIETRPGASEIIAGDAVAKAKPDGYTLFLGADSNFSNNQFLFTKLPFNPERDLVPVTQLFELPFCLIVPGDFPAKSVKEFVEIVRKGSYQYASSGPGSPNHLSMESMNKTLGITMLHVPYKVGPQIVQDLIAGLVNAVVAGVNTAAPFVPTGKLKVLAVSGSKRQKALPDTPTFAEAGFPEVNIQSYVGLVAPRDTPPEVLEKIATDIRTVMATEEFQQKVGEPFGYTPVGSSPRQFREFLVKKRMEAQRQVKALGLKLD